MEICLRLAPLLQQEVASTIPGGISLLGAGRQSLLRSKETIRRPKALIDYCSRKNQAPLADVISRNNTHNIVNVLYGRESAGPIIRRQAIPTRFYVNQNLLRRTLGHLSAVYCVLFDRSGKYIITVNNFTKFRKEICINLINNILGRWWFTRQTLECNWRSPLNYFPRSICRNHRYRHQPRKHNVSCWFLR